MKLSRRKFLHLAADAAALPAVSRIAWAQTYPSQPVRLIVPAPAGGGFDGVARLIGQWLSDRLGQPFVIEDRPGAGAIVGTQLVVHSPPSGYTLLLVSASNAIRASLDDKLHYNFIRDIAPVAGIIREPDVMLVNPAVPAKTVFEFIGHAKANPGKLNMASGGNGTPSHMAGELFKMMTGINIVHVPYRGTASALIDVIGGRAQVLFASMTSSIGHVKAGKLRALAVTTAMRSAELPDIPTVGEFVPDYEASAWFGIGAPKGTPVEVINKLNKEINAALADPKMKERLADIGGTPLPGSPADFGKLIADETEKWGKVVKFAGIKLE